VRNYHIYIFLLIVFGFGLLAKLVSAEPGGSEKPKKGLIEGWVTEQEKNIPVEYANVVVFSISDSAMVTGGITGPEGQFKLDNIPFGEYYVVINFIGFEKKTIDQVVVSEFDRKIDLGKIQLGYSAVQLQGTEIVAERQAVEFKLDKKVINVDQDISSAGSSATDILQNAPSVRVDIEGNVQLRGSSNFTVLIDGKPSILSGNEALQQIPATAIENIEIITNPSAKYDPDGTTGIINIVMKKQNLKGFSGMVEASAGTGDKYTSNLYLNYRNGKFNVYGGVEWNDRRFPRTETAIRETYSGDTTFVRLTDSESAWKRNGLNFKGGVDFFLDDKTTFNLGGEYGNYGFGWDNFSNVQEYSNPASTERYYRDNNIFAWERYSFGLSGSMMRKFEQQGHSLNVFAFYSERGGKQEQDKKEIDTDENFEPIDSDPFLLRSIEEGPSKRFRAEIDYVKPVLENGKIEAGYHLRMGDEEESYLLETYDVDLNEWQVDDNYSKKALYTRNIHAIYGMFAHEFKGFQYQAGIRAEYTYRDITVANTGESSTIDRFDFFPSVHISKRLLEKNQFSASYSRRIDRPRGWYLEPFETFIDESTRRIPFGFLGTGWDYFKIWLVNTILSILTLGIYSAWAKVRRKRYLYGSTRLQGSGFEYLADPVKILKGRALVVCFFILYSLLDQFLPFLAGALSLGIVVLLPWVVVKSLSFNARNSAYRNIRFGFNGSYMGAAKAYILWPILVPFTLGILFPYVFYRQKAFIVENHTYGTTPFSFDATAGDYYRIFLTGLIPLGIGLGLAVLLAFLFRPLSLVALAGLYFYLFAFFSVKTTNLMYGSARLDLHRFSADLEIKGYGLIVLTNTLATVLTLGLFHPWALIRTLRYKVRHLTLIAAGSLDGFIAAEQKQVSAIGEEAGDFLDIDVGL